MDNIIEIKPIKTAEYIVKQPKYKGILYGLPTRSILLGPSGSGKSVLLVNMILDIYRGCFEKVYIFSPSITLDKTWTPVKEYCKTHLNQKDENEYYFSEYNPSDLEYIINLQYKIIEYQKQIGLKHLYQICIIIDDFIDQPKFCHSSNSLLNSLYIRGRHLCISTIASTQGYKCISPLIRKNITELFIFRLRNSSDLYAWIEELSAVYDKDTLYNMYKMVTDQPFAFLYINLMTSDKKNMFFDSLKTKLIPKR